MNISARQTILFFLLLVPTMTWSMENPVLTPCTDDREIIIPQQFTAIKLTTRICPSPLYNGPEFMHYIVNQSKQPKRSPWTEHENNSCTTRPSETCIGKESPSPQSITQVSPLMGTKNKYLH